MARGGGGAAQTVPSLLQARAASVCSLQSSLQPPATVAALLLFCPPLPESPTPGQRQLSSEIMSDLDDASSLSRAF